MTKTNVKSKNDLSCFLEPSSIAVIGASNDSSKISGRPIEYLQRYGFVGGIYPVNPKYELIQGLPAYKSIYDLPDNVDLVIIAIAADHVIDCLKTCIIKNVKSCMIFSSGFAEMGEEGRALQNEISVIAKESDMYIIGPNCQGIANLKSKSITSFSTAFAEGDLVNGSSAILSQSGAVAAMIYNMQKDEGVGVKYWVSTGNEADISIPKIVDYVLDDPDIKVIQLYMENIKDGNEIIDISKKSRDLNIPILVLKPGKSEEGQRAASSHTGALASEDIVIDKVLDHYGLVRVDDVNEMSSFSKVFRLSKRVQGKNVAILSNSGGLGVMMVDKCKEYGLNIVDFEEETVQRLSKILPVFASYENPIDVTAQLLNDKKLLSNALPILMDDSNVDIILFGMGIIGKGYDIETITSEIIQAQKDGGKLISVAWVGSKKGIIGGLNQNGVPAFEDPTLCIKAISKYADYCLRNKLKTVPSQKENKYLIKQAFLEKVENNNGFLSEYDSKSVLSSHFPIGEVSLCANEEDIRKIGEELRYPVVMKINSSEIQHKSEVGGVKLNIQSPHELLTAYREMLNNTRLPKFKEEFVVLIEEMVESGFEISLGLKRDPVFGPIIMVASGGIYIEVLKDFQLLIPPVTYEQAEKAVNSLAMSPLLKGIRGNSNKDINELCNVIVRFSEFALQNDKVLEEVDLNPIIVGEEGKGVKIVDALIKVVRNGGLNEK